MLYEMSIHPNIIELSLLSYSNLGLSKIKCYDTIMYHCFQTENSRKISCKVTSQFVQFFLAHFGQKEPFRNMQLRIRRDGKQHEIKVLRVASAGTNGAVPGQQPAVQGCLAGFLQLQDQDFQSQGRYHEGMEACSLQSVVFF